MQSRPDQIIVLSLDYDGCGQDLFAADAVAASFLKNLNKLITDATKFTTAEVHVYVGSARQDISIDKAGDSRNHNGSCFTNYRRLCAAQGWTFQPLLLADIHHKLPSGTAIENEKYRVQSVNPSKIDILQIQLDDITSRFPNTPIDFIFIDDDAHGHRILDTNAHHFEFALPENVSLKLIQYESSIEVDSESSTSPPKALSETLETTIIVTINASLTQKFHFKPTLRFDPINTSGYKSAVLNQLLLSCVKKGNEIFYPDISYSGEFNDRSNQSIRKRFKLTGNFKALYFRPCASTSYGYRFEIVSDQQLGRGSFGTVFDGITTLIPLHDGCLLQKAITDQQQQPRVHKHAAGKYPADVLQLISRSASSHQARHLHVKQITLNPDTAPYPASFTAMRKMPGKMLSTVLKENVLNTQQAISLALSILYAYRDQLHAYQLVHGDIKPRNILINYTTPIQANFIDYDTCKTTSSSDRRPTGTMRYCPPEYWQAEYADGSTPQADMYALGITIGRLFFKTLLVNEKSYRPDFNNCVPSDFSTNEEKSAIIKCITEMTLTDRTQRCSIDVAIQTFEQLRLKQLSAAAAIQCHYDQAAAFSKIMRDQFAGKPASLENIIAFLEQFVNELHRQTLKNLDPNLSADCKQFIATVAGWPAFPDHSIEVLFKLACRLHASAQYQTTDRQKTINHLTSITNKARESGDAHADIVLQIMQFLDYVKQKSDARSHKYSLNLEHIQIILNKTIKDRAQLFEYDNTFKNGVNKNSSYFLFKPVVIERQRQMTHLPDGNCPVNASLSLG